MNTCKMSTRDYISNSRRDFWLYMCVFVAYLRVIFCLWPVHPSSVHYNKFNYYDDDDDDQ